MLKLNHLQYATPVSVNIDRAYSLEPLKDNSVYENKFKQFTHAYGYNHLNTFNFSQDGFLSLMLKLQGKIAVSLGESESIVNAAMTYKNLGFDIELIELNKNGTLKIEQLKNETFDFVFISPYVMDTFVTVDLQAVKQLTSAKIISNIYATLDCTDVDIALFDAYKLTGFATSSVALHNGELEEQYLGEIDSIAVNLIYEVVCDKEAIQNSKQTFIHALKAELLDDMFFFVEPDITLESSLHFGLKGIKAREIIRTLSLSSIFVTNGEGCSLGLARPSRIIQAMGYTELESRQALSLSLHQDIESSQAIVLAKKLAKAYRQIKALNG